MAVLSASFVACLSLTSVAFAGTKSWDRFENGYFIAYSSASEKKTRKLLGDLESFRAAFVQIGNITIPLTAPKTRVIIVRNQSEFSKLIYNRNVAGFAQRTDKGKVLVLPASGDSDWTKSVIQHEYGHALLEFKKVKYPRWYQEGFSEIVSTTEVTRDGESFKFGGLPYRLKFFARPVFDWNVLVSDNFTPHTIINPVIGSSAYAQAWMLAHYLTLGSQANAINLQAYFRLIGAGESSTEAFVKAFGSSAKELWKTDLRAYVRRMPEFTFKFASGMLDLEFVRTEAADNEIRPLIDYFEQRALAYGRGKSPRKPLTHLPGQWSSINVNGSCDKTKQLVVNEDDRTITMERFMRDADDEWLRRVFSYQRAEKRAYKLMVVEGLAPGEEGIPWRLEMRSKELLCFSRTDMPPCVFIWKKCVS